MSKIVIIKENSPQIRNKLENSGFSICVCAEFKDSIWLSYNPDLDLPFDIHGQGYCDQGDWEEKYTPLERIQMRLGDLEYYPRDREFFDTVEEFLEKYHK